MTISPSASSCGGSAAADHQITSSLMVSSLAKARSWPSSVPSRLERRQPEEVVVLLPRLLTPRQSQPLQPRANTGGVKKERAPRWTCSVEGLSLAP